jgi:lipoprotein-releasing system ATP-binding protein
MPAPLLQLVAVSKRYEGPDGSAAVPVLQDIHLELEPGESLAIVGPSGCGKSTLLNLLGTLDRPSGGSVRLNGQDLADLTDTALAAVRNRRIGFVFQSHFLLPQCTVLENVLVPTLATRDSAQRADAPRRARQLLERVGLGTRLGHRPGQLSGGERQRVAVVRALINHPDLLLADEPTGALDRAAAGLLGDLLVQLNREQGVALVLATHATDLAQRMGRVLELRDGQLQPLDHERQTPNNKQ